MIYVSLSTIPQRLKNLNKSVESLLKQKLEAGVHKVEWNATGFASGMYIYRYVNSDKVITRKMLYLK